MIRRHRCGLPPPGLPRMTGEVEEGGIRSTIPSKGAVDFPFYKFSPAARPAVVCLDGLPRPARCLPQRARAAGAADARQGGDGRDRRLHALADAHRRDRGADQDRPLLPHQRQDQRTHRQCRRPRRRRAGPGQAGSGRAAGRAGVGQGKRRFGGSAGATDVGRFRAPEGAFDPRQHHAARPRPGRGRHARGPGAAQAGAVRPQARRGPALLHRAARRRRRHHHQAKRRGRPSGGPGAADLHPGARRRARCRVQRP